MSTSCAPKMNFAKRYLAAAEGKAPGGFPFGDQLDKR